jgi:hypothetical protein
MIALIGQGKPLPVDCPYEGEWILEDVLFLFERKVRQTSGQGSPTFPARFQRADGKWCFGLHADVLAMELRVEVEQLFEANRDKKLLLFGVKDFDPRHGGPVAKRCLFALEGTMCEVLVETMVPESNA